MIPNQTGSDSSTVPTRFAFLLLNNFTLVSLASATDILRMANYTARSECFRWQLVSETGGAVFSSDRILVNVDGAMQDRDSLNQVDAVVVCGGIDIEDNCNVTVLRWLRQVNRRRIALGAICTGTHVLAKAGLLDGYRCSIHWENVAVLRESFPKVHVGTGLYSIDRNRFTSSGGTAPIDMMLHFVARKLGPATSAAVADMSICDRIRRADDQQRIPLRHLLGNQSEKLIGAVELMEANLTEPIGQKELADYVGLSGRQLQRLFRKHLLCSPSRYYLQLRLQRARELLQKTGLSILEISSVCGFISTSHFSKSYKEFFGFSPSKERLKARETGETSAALFD